MEHELSIVNLHNKNSYKKITERRIESDSCSDEEYVRIDGSRFYHQFSYLRKFKKIVNREFTLSRLVITFVLGVVCIGVLKKYRK